MREYAKRAACLLLTVIISVTAAAVLAEEEIIGVELNNDITPEEPVEPDEPVAPDEPEEPDEPDEPDEPVEPDDSQEYETDGGEGDVILTERLEVAIDNTTLTPGESTRAHCRAYPKDASRDVKWASSDPGVAKITGDGVIRIAPGAKIPEGGQYIDIWAKACDGSLVMALQTIYVLPQVKRVKLFIGDTTVYSGDEAPFLSVYVDIQPASLFGLAKIVWKSSDPKIAMVAPGGQMGEAARIIWYEPGEVTISACAASNPDCRDSMKLTVLPPQK